MDRLRAWRSDPLAIVASAIGIAGLTWLAPLMFDQLVFFGDREQTRQAAASRALMLPAAAILLVGSAGIFVRRMPQHALLAALPGLVAVPLALLAPSTAFQLLAYGVTAPMSLGALLSAAVPLPRQLPAPWLLVGAAAMLALAVLAASFVALLVLVAVVVWWRLPARAAGSVAPPNRR